MLQFNLDYFFKKISNLFIINIERDPTINMQSIYLARQEYLGKKDLWISVKPKEYPMLKDLDVYHQIAGQLYYTKKSINNSLKKIPEKSKITIQYENLCKSPNQIYCSLSKKYNKNGLTLENKYKGVEKFSISDNRKISKDEIVKFEEAYNYFSKKDNDYND
jgi:hypothetical protein